MVYIKDLFTPTKYMEILEFRRMLDEITNRGLPSKHPDLINSLKEKYEHKITLFSIFGYTTGEDCFKSVFKNEVPENVWRKFENLGPNSEKFIQELILDGFLDLHSQQKSEDKVVVYFKDNQPKHFGRLDGDMIISKWGKGQTWKHRFWEAPLSYGDEIKFSSCTINIDLFNKKISNY